MVSHWQFVRVLFCFSAAATFRYFPIKQQLLRATNQPGAAPIGWELAPLKWILLSYWHPLNISVLLVSHIVTETVRRRFNSELVAAFYRTDYVTPLLPDRLSTLDGGDHNIMWFGQTSWPCPPLWKRWKSDLLCEWKLGGLSSVQGVSLCRRMTSFVCELSVLFLYFLPLMFL